MQLPPPPNYFCHTFGKLRFPPKGGSKQSAPARCQYINLIARRLPLARPVRGRNSSRQDALPFFLPIRFGSKRTFEPFDLHSNWHQGKGSVIVFHVSQKNSAFKFASWINLIYPSFLPCLSFLSLAGVSFSLSAVGAGAEPSPRLGDAGRPSRAGGKSGDRGFEGDGFSGLRARVGHRLPCREPGEACSIIWEVPAVVGGGLSRETQRKVPLPRKFAVKDLQSGFMWVGWSQEVALSLSN